MFELMKSQLPMQAIVLLYIFVPNIYIYKYLIFKLRKIISERWEIFPNSLFKVKSPAPPPKKKLKKI